MILMFLLMFQDEFRFSFKTESFSVFDIQKSEFHCLLSNESIPLKKYNDGVCDCCDGSDEYENANISCTNTCPVDMDKYNASLLNNLFNTAIFNSQQNQLKSLSILKEIRDIKIKSDSEILYWNNLYQNSKYKHDYYKNELNTIVKEILNITDNDEEMQNPILQSLTDVFKIFKQTKIQNRNKSNLLTAQTIDTKVLQDLFNLSFTTNQSKSLKNLTEKALIRAFEEKNYSVISKIGELLHKKRKNSKKMKTYNNEKIIATNVKDKMETLISQNVGMNNEWCQYLTGTINWNMPLISEQIIIENMRSVKIISNHGINYYITPVKISDTFIFSNIYNQKIILKPICAPELTMLKHHLISSDKRVFFFGTPVICPTEYSENNFIDFFRNIQYFI